MILSSLMPPTTFTSTLGFLASYSATTFLNSFSSRALHPTHTVSVVASARADAAVPALAVPLVKPPTAAASRASAATSTTVVVRRFMKPS